jgi:wyosine [tRNA(Phe)-imidazoG37] synthetase (radical SAM superfamily)
MGTPTKLTTLDHDRDAAGLRYVYPVVSRRAGGVSVGINLNPNNACNWHCVYCQVPNLTRGAAPQIDLPQLEAELRELLARVRSPQWLAEHVDDPAYRRIVDIAFSGNGEPTTARPFDTIVARALHVVDEATADLPEFSRVLITNGSMMGREDVRRGIALLGEAGGEVWFKLDRVGQDERNEINGSNTSADSARAHLRACAARCRTRLQTCVFGWDGQPPSEATQAAYLAFVREELAAGTPIADVLLYGLARPSMQPEAPRLSRLPEAWLQAFAQRIEAVGLPVVVRA